MREKGTRLFLLIHGQLRTGFSVSVVVSGVCVAIFIMYMYMYLPNTMYKALAVEVLL